MKASSQAIAIASSRPRALLAPSRLRRHLPFLFSLALAFAIWQLLVSLLSIPSYVLPDPFAVWTALCDGLIANPLSRASFWFHLADTLTATLAGFATGCALALIGASLMAEFGPIERMAMPYVVGLQSMPKVAIAPLLIIWLGYGIESKVAMAAVLSLFPILVNSLHGFRSTPLERLELMRVIKAGRWQTYRRVKLPSALPFILTGMNLGIVYALLGTIVAEFIGGRQGIGVMMTQLQSSLDTAGVFAILLLLAATGYLLMIAMRTIQARLAFWAEPQLSGELR